ncbi:SRPBCC family protein [Aquipuribacter sp. MA13-6]|uniref:SRPBCC family protein n=1 Tax=unclassified Aquipuribacter TaxID=2635084 RepID=UPI003EEA3A73
MDTITSVIEVDVPLQTAYDQWTQFEDFPRFMSGVETITQLDDRRTHWVMKIAGVSREFDAEVLVQRPDQGVSWRSTDGPTHAGRVTFVRLDDTRTEVTLAMDWQPEGLVEKAGDALGIVESQAKKDLQGFKQFIEERGTATGSWRGDVDTGSTAPL